MRKITKKILSIALVGAMFLSSIGIQSFSSKAAESETQNDVTLDLSKYEEISETVSDNPFAYNGTVLEWAWNNSYAKYSVDFGDEEYDSIRINAAFAQQKPEGGAIQISVDAPYYDASEEQKLAVFNNTDEDIKAEDWANYYDYERKLNKSLTGECTIYVTFAADLAGNVKGITFYSGEGNEGDSGLDDSSNNYPGAYYQDVYPFAEDHREEKIIEYELNGTIYYVSADGTADGNGTKENPWNSVAYAASVVPANQTIFVESGTYDETKPIYLKSGVNLIGEDKETTIINVCHNGPSISQEYGTGNIIAGFTVDGKSEANLGLYVYRAKNMVITDMKVINFKDVALRFYEVKDCDFYNLYTKNTGHVAELSGSNCKFHDVFADEHRQREQAGWGIDIGTQTYAYDWEFYDVVVHVPFRGSWNAGNGYYPPSMAFESCAGNVKNIEVRNCEFNNTISLVPFVNKPEDTSFSFHNNILRLEDGETYGFEVAKQLTNCEIYENLVIGGSHLFSNWDGDDLTGLSVYRNIFDVVTDNDNYWDQIAFLGTHYTDVSFQNNTFVVHEVPTRTAHDGTPLLFNIGDGPIDSVVYQNNILVYDNEKEAFPEENNVLHAQKGTVENNLFWNLTAFSQGTNNIVADPLFVGTGNALEKYSLSEGSPAIDAGVNLDAFTPADGKTDLGALEYGEEAFKVGPYQTGYKPVNQFNFVGADYNGELQDWKDTIDSIVFYDCYTVNNIYTDQKDTLEKLMDESLLMHYAQYESLNVVDSYSIEPKAFRTKFVVKLKDGSYDGIGSYTCIEGVSLQYSVDDTNVITTDNSGEIRVSEGGSTKFHVTLMHNGNPLGTGSVTINAESKIFNEKYSYHPMSSEDFWVVGETGRVFDDSDTLGFIYIPGTGIEYHINVAKSGKYDLYFRYAVWGSGNSIQNFYLDDNHIHSCSLETTGGYGGNEMKDYKLELELEAGNHNLQIVFGGGDSLNYGAIILVPQEETTIDTFNLEQALIQFGELKKENYNAEQWEVFEEAYKQSQELLKKDNLTQYEVESQFIKLLTWARKLYENYRYLKGIEIASNPDRMAYQAGETLDLTDLSVEVTYSDKSTKVISYEEFQKYGITVNVEDGKVLTADDDKLAVEVEFYKYAASTDAITVSVESGETPDETPDDTPSETPDDTPGETPDETPDNTPGEAPDDTPSETPDDTDGGKGEQDKIPNMGDEGALAVTGYVMLMAAMCAVVLFAIIKKRNESLE